MNAIKTNNVKENRPMMENLENRELYSVSMLPAVQCPSDPAPVVGITQPLRPQTNIIAVLIGL
jgi:hypothetical protein